MANKKLLSDKKLGQLLDEGDLRRVERQLYNFYLGLEIEIMELEIELMKQTKRNSIVSYLKSIIYGN